MSSIVNGSIVNGSTINGSFNNDSIVNDSIFVFLRRDFADFDTLLVLYVPFLIRRVELRIRSQL